MRDYDNLKEELMTHIKADEKQFDCINQSLDKILNNHLAHIQESMNSIENSHIELQTNTAWLLKFFWIIATSSLGALVTSLLTLILDK